MFKEWGLPYILHEQAPQEFAYVAMKIKLEVKILVDTWWSQNRTEEPRSYIVHCDDLASICAQFSCITKKYEAYNAEGYILNMSVNDDVIGDHKNTGVGTPQHWSMTGLLLEPMRLFKGCEGANISGTANMAYNAEIIESICEEHVRFKESVIAASAAIEQGDIYQNDGRS